MKSFFHRLKAFFVRALGSSDWAHTAATTLKLIAPLAQGIAVAAAGEAAGHLVGSIVNEVIGDLGTAAVLMDEIKRDSTGTVVTQVQNALASANLNLGQLLAAGHIKDPATLAKVTGIVKTVTGEVSAIMAELPALSGTGQQTPPASPTVISPSSIIST